MDVKPETPSDPSNCSMTGAFAISQEAGRSALSAEAGFGAGIGSPAAVTAAAAPHQGAAAIGDRRLVALAQTGDERAFAELVERHAPRVYALARRIVRSPADAEEVAQDAFVRAWRAIGSYRGDAAFGTWLHRITARRALDRAAVLSTRRAREAPEEAAGEPSASAWSAPAPAEDALAPLLAELPPIQRAALTLFYYEDQSVKQVALDLDLPEGTVKTHLHRGRQALRAAYLRREGKDDSHALP